MNSVISMAVSEKQEIEKISKGFFGYEYVYENELVVENQRKQQEQEEARKQEEQRAFQEKCDEFSKNYWKYQ
jgi:hypothetical protein